MRERKRAFSIESLYFHYSTLYPQFNFDITFNRPSFPRNNIIVSLSRSISSPPLTPPSKEGTLLRQKRNKRSD